MMLLKLWIKGLKAVPRTLGFVTLLGMGFMPISMLHMFIELRRQDSTPAETVILYGAIVLLWIFWVPLAISTAWAVCGGGRPGKTFEDQIKDYAHGS